MSIIYLFVQIFPAKPDFPGQTKLIVTEFSTEYISGVVAQWQRVRLQIERLGVRFPLASLFLFNIQYKFDSNLQNLKSSS